MKFFLSLITLILGFQKAVNLEDVQNWNQNGGNSSAIVISHKEKETDILDSTQSPTDGVSALKESVPLSLPELYVIAKNISHSKGIYQQPNTFIIPDDRELRRSIIRKVSVTSESDAIRNILNTFEAGINKVAYLEEMEYLVHQYDVAVNFANLGGIEIISPFLFSSDDRIASSAASLLGAAMQSNPIVQKLALKQNIGNALLQLLSHESPTVLSRVIFALASFLRNAPEAQDQFFTLGGVSNLAEILRNHDLPTHTKIKTINLFGDLAVEYLTSQLYLNEQNVEHAQKLERLFTTQVLSYDICNLIPPFLNFEDLDNQLKIVAAMASLLKICLKHFQNEIYISRIKQLIELYNPEIEGIPHNIDFKLILHNELKMLLKNIVDEDIGNMLNEYYIKKIEL